MKKFVLVVMAMAMLLFVAACGKECDICGEKGRGETKEVLGKEYFVCKDCLETQDNINNILGNLFK